MSSGESENHRRPCVLVTCAGSDAAYGFVRTIRRRWGQGLLLVGVDRYPAHLAPASELLDHYEMIEDTFADDRIETILEIAEVGCVDLIVPFADDELLPLAAHHDLAGARLAVNDVSVVEQLQDRLGLADLLDATATDRDDLRSPQTWLLERARWHRHGLIVKPRFDRDDPGVAPSIEVIDAEHLAELQSSTNRRRGTGPYVAQIRCGQPELTIDVFRSRAGDVVRAVCRERLAVQGGQMSRTRVFDDPELTDLVAHLLDGLELSGLFCLQVMEGQTGLWVVIDMKLRPALGCALTIAAGVDLYSMFVADQLGQPTDPSWCPPLAHDRYAVRATTEWISSGPDPDGEPGILAG